MLHNSKAASSIIKEKRNNPLKKRWPNALLRTKITLENQNGDQMTGWLIVVLVVVVVGAIFMTLYQGSITSIWNSIVDKITGLLS